MFSIPLKISPAEAECVTCIIQTKNICWDFCHLPGSGIFTFQAGRQLFRFSYPVAIGCTPPLCPTPSRHRKNAWSWRLNGSAVTRLSECSWHHGCAPEQRVFALSPRPCLPSPCFLWQDFKYSNSRRFLLNPVNLKCIAS